MGVGTRPPPLLLAGWMKYFAPILTGLPLESFTSSLPWVQTAAANRNVMRKGFLHFDCFV
ncbi:hypothetical protein YC2023_080188 [Brassica napus]